jgi:hypothetical protein
MKKNKTIAVLLLSLMLCPPLIPLISQGPGGPEFMSSTTSVSTDKVTVANDTEEVTRTLSAEKWTNGTLLHFSTSIPELQETINLTTWINTTVPEESTNLTTASTPSVSGSLPLPHLIVDDLQFLGKGKNDTYYTSYEHDNNYEVYYPLQWNLPYALNGTVDNMCISGQVCCLHGLTAT